MLWGYVWMDRMRYRLIFNYLFFPEWSPSCPIPLYTDKFFPPWFVMVSLGCPESWSCWGLIAVAGLVALFVPPFSSPIRGVIIILAHQGWRWDARMPHFVGVPRAVVVSRLLGKTSLKHRGCLAHLLGSPSAPGVKGSGQGSPCLHSRVPWQAQFAPGFPRSQPVSGPLTCASQVPLALGSRG